MSLSFYLPTYLLSKRKCLENSHGFLSFSKLIFVGIYLLYNIVLVSAVQQNVSAIHLHTQPTPFWISFPFRSPCALSRVPWVIQQVLLSYLFYMQYKQCRHVNSSFPVHCPFLPWYPYICSLCLCLYFCFAKKFIYMIFLDFTYMQYLFFSF